VEVNYRLGRDAQALADLDFLQQRGEKRDSICGYRALIQARRGDAVAARRELTALRTLRPDAAGGYVDTAVAVYLGDAARGLRPLDADLNDRPASGHALFLAGRLYALATGLAGRGGAAEHYASRAIDLLRQALDRGEPNARELLLEADLEALYGHPGFTDLVRRYGLDRRYTAVWHEQTDLTARELHGLDPAAHREECRRLSAEGFRPMSVAVAEVAPGRRLAASVWHRPRLEETDLDALLRGRARLAAALLRLGRPEFAWRLLRHTPDPGLRSWLIHRLQPLQTPVPLLAARLSDEPDVTARRGLLLVLGEYPREQAPPGLRDQVRRLYEDDPDAGIHSAAEWLLRRWKEATGQQQKRGTHDPAPACDWWVIPEGLTMVRVGGPVKFIMGSPPDEPGRKAIEVRHRKIIPRSFAVSSTEVSVGLFKQFREECRDTEHVDDLEDRPDPDAPVIEVSYLDALRFCRWLSDRAGIPREEMCYPPLGEIRVGMELDPDCLSRTGYRLLTEAEWEYCCRAGATTSRFYGESATLLPSYGWYLDNAEERARPCGQLKPNDLGLFDVYGDAWEWCADLLADYRPEARGLQRLDANIGLVIAAEGTRVLRGGGFVSLAHNARSARIHWAQAKYTLDASGFRIARTLR
jgi:formylglycine-generating enzyme required for sulfatase activity